MPRCRIVPGLFCVLALLRLRAMAADAAIGGSAAPVAPATLANPSSDELSWTSEGPVSFDFNTHEMVGHKATLRDGLMLFSADEIHYNRATFTISAFGHVSWTNGSARLLATSLVYNRRDQTVRAGDVRVGRHPFYVSGLSAEGPVNRIVIRHAEVTYNEPGPWRPTVHADTVIYSPGHYLRLGNSRVGISGGPMIPVFHVGKKLDASAALDYVKFSGGYRSSLGATGTAALRIPVNDTAKVGGDLSIFTARGLMAGPAVNYQSADQSGDLTGYFDSGFINDYGKRLPDVFGNPVPHARAFAEGRHQEQVTDDLTVDADFNWWRDSEVMRDFRPKDFYVVQEPDNFVESVYSGGDYMASAFVRAQPNSFDPVQERAPELRLDVLPTAVGDGFFMRSNASADNLIERPPGGGQELSSHRLDLFYGISRPFTEGDWLSFVPVAGTRITNYTDTEGAAVPGGYTRTLGEVGFDALLHSSGTFDYQNKRWDIDGLRHLFTPHIIYRYIPEADAGQKYIPDIDRQSFTTYLEPLELGDVRYIDNLHPINTLRLGFDNTLQTRDKGYGSRDLVYLNVNEDLLFKKQANDPDSSEIHTDFGLKPTKWLDLDTSTIFRLRSLAVREVETGLTIHDADLWSVHLGNDFLRRENDDYVAEFRVRLNEVYRLHLVTLYDERQHIFPEQSFSLEQNLVNTWAIRYVITLSQGPNRDGHFGFNVQFDLIHF